jgi:hypothetical protein
MSLLGSSLFASDLSLLAPGAGESPDVSSLSGSSLESTSSIVATVAAIAKKSVART